MDPARERLTAHLIDFAGTHPPASLSPEAALAAWSLVHAGPEARSLRALAWPVTDLDRLSEGEFSGDVTVLGRSGGDWDLAREEDAAALTRFARTLPDRIGLVAYECPLPQDHPVSAALDSLSGFGGVQVYVETTNAEALAEIAERDWASARFSITRGGDGAAALAEFLYGCVSLELPFKLAGLAGGVTGANGLGVRNALDATALAIADDLTPQEIAAILRSERPTWREVEREEAEDARGLFEAVELVTLDGLLALDGGRG